MLEFERLNPLSVHVPFERKGMESDIVSDVFPK